MKYNKLPYILILFTASVLSIYGYKYISTRYEVKRKDNVLENTNISPTILPSPTPTNEPIKVKQISNTTLRVQCIEQAKSEESRMNEKILELSDQGELGTSVRDALNATQKWFEEERENCAIKYK